MEKLFLFLIEKGGPFGLILLAMMILVAFGLWLRQRNLLSLGDKTRVVNRDELSQINRRLGDIDGSLRVVDKRLTEVEHDIETRPSRKEFHDLEKGFVRLETGFLSVAREVKQTRASVSRIEDHMYAVAEQSAKGR
ncbi:MAG: hypothetical protein OXR62_10955 [Ahrensia sp.]|nr:hypothetical protein [Ahrensia sp.]